MSIFPTNLRNYLDMKKPPLRIGEVAFLVESPSGTALRLELSYCILSTSERAKMSQGLYSTELDSALGRISIVYDDQERIWELSLEGADGSTTESAFPEAQSLGESISTGFSHLVEALYTYIEEELTVRCVLTATSQFRLEVCLALLTIPRGRLRSYQSIAEQVGQARALQAVGTAVGANPISLLIPCHRVIRSNGHIGGYAHGIARKEQILAYELPDLESSLF